MMLVAYLHEKMMEKQQLMSYTTLYILHYFLMFQNLWSAKILSHDARDEMKKSPH